jgi:hypothetical protein
MTLKGHGTEKPTKDFKVKLSTFSTTMLPFTPAFLAINFMG